MAAEISRLPNPTFLPAGAQAINEGIVQAALSQAPESIEQAMRSFDSILGKESYTESHRTAVSRETVAPLGFVAPPVDYIAIAIADGAPSGEIVSADQLLAAFRNPNFGIRQGVQSFLQSGFQESLASLKPKLGSKFARPEVLEPLNDILVSSEMKNLNASRLQPSMEAVNELYSVLKKMEASNTHLQANMLRMIRA